MARILVVDDEPILLRTLFPILLKAGHEVVVATDGEEALARARHCNPDLIILDVVLPKIDGLEVCHILRQESTVPILMLTGMDGEVDKVLGLEMGADDYLTKPFGARELLARVKALLRRVEMDSPSAEANCADNEIPVPHRLAEGELEVDLVTGRVTRAGRRLTMKPREFDLLAFLMHHRGRAFSPRHLMREIWGYEDTSDTRTVVVHIHWLRGKVEADPSNPRLIETVRGVGYRFRVDDPNRATV